MKSVLIKCVENVRLTKGQIPIAEYFCRNEVQICFMALSEVASALDVNDTAIMRFCRAIGFNGFKELQKELRNNLLQFVLENSQESDLTERLEKTDDVNQTNALSERYLDVTIQNLRQSMDITESDKYEKAADLIAQANRKYIVGFRGCSGTVESFAQGLRYFVDDVVKITSGYTEAIEKIIDISSDDVLVIISYSRYGEIDRIITEIAQKKGAKIVTISDMPSSPITQNVDIVLHTAVKSMSFFNSQVSAMFTIEVLMSYLSYKYKDRTRTRLSELDKYIKEIL